MPDLLEIERIDVGEAALDARIRVPDPSLGMTSALPGLAERLESLLPGLARHSCENDRGRDFLQELRDTQIAHCVEHVAAELMALSGSPRTLKGETRWDFARDGAGVYRVHLEFDDDLVALAALSESIDIVKWAAGAGSERPQIERIAERLRDLRAVPSA